MTTPKRRRFTHPDKSDLLSFFWVFLSVIPFYSSAQNQSEKGLPFITNYPAKDYKANPQNWAIMEDNDGLMYFGNQGLVLQYDGVKWKKIFFPGNTAVAIRSLAKDKNGRIYYGATSDFGYLQLDSYGMYQQVSLKYMIPDSAKEFFDIWTTHVTENGIYFQSRDYIYFLPQNSKGEFEKNAVKVWKPQTKFMYAFYLDHQYYIHEQGLGMFKLVNDVPVFIPGSEFMGSERVQIMLPYTSPGAPSGSGEKKYLFGLFYSGLFIFDGKSFKPFRTEADEIVKTASLYKGIQLKDGSYALSTTGKGLAIINAEGKILKVINRKVGLQDESVYGIFQDHKGMLWLALDNGLSRVEISSPLTQFTIQSGLTTASLSLTRYDGDLYLGTTNGLLRLNEKTAVFEPISGIPLTQVFTLKVKDDRLLVPNDGLFYIKDKKVSLIKASSSGDMQMSAIIPLKYHPNIILSGATFGVAVFYKDRTAESKNTWSWKYAGLIPGIPDGIWSFTEPNDSIAWAGSQNSVVYRIAMAYTATGEPDLSKTRVKKLEVNDGLGIGGGQVYLVKGENYFPADSAIYTYDEKTGRFSRTNIFGTFPKAGGKDENFMKEDSSGRVWVRFGKVMRVATPKPDGSYSLDETPLLPIAGATMGQIYPEKNGIVWFCTTDGLVRYDEKQTKDYDESFKTILTHITANKTILSVARDSLSKIEIPYKDNTLRFEYAAPFFEQEDKTQYQTWLEGFDSGWSTWDNNTYKEYTNLPEGKYSFHVRAKNIYHKISEEYKYTFNVDAPLWRSWWAWLLYIATGIAVVYFIIRYRTRKLKTQQVELEKKISERTHEVQMQAEELTTVNQISQALVSQLNLDDLIKLIGDEMRQVFKADIVYLAMLDKKTNLINFPYQFGELLPPMKFGDGIASRIISSGKPLLINKNLTQEVTDLGIKLLGLLPASYLGVPIPIENEIIGVLSVQNTKKEDYFDEKDQRLLSTIAANVGMALKKAKLFEELQHAKMVAEEASANAARANEAKSAFLSTVSHELRTPLTSVLGFAKIIKKRLEERIFPSTNQSDPKTEKAIHQVSENLDVVISEGQRLTHLINDVLDLAKIEAGKMEWNLENVSIPEIVNRALATASSLVFQKDIRLESSVEPGLPEITGDQDKLIQVVVNLLSNAVKFTDHGVVTVRVYKAGHEIVTSVTDTGIGIDKKDYGAVFEQFKQVGGDTLTDKPKGTGLGLPICKEIVEHLGGRIWLDSDPGKGSTFYFALPIIKSSPVAKPLHLDDLISQLKKQIAQSKFNLKDGNATILVVDDDDAIRSLLKQEFGDAGYLVQEAVNGKEALEIIRGHRPDLIVMDVMMPEMNGFDVAAILKNDPQTMEIPIIILSIVQDKARGYRIGVDRYLTKPIDTAQLFAEVGVLLEQGKSKKKVLVVDEDTATIKTLTSVLQTKGYQVFESDGKELLEKAVAAQPDIIILNSIFSGKHEIVQSLRFEKGLENVLFLIYQ